MMYVTLERAKAHLNMDHDEDDNLIGLYITAASRAVKNYLKSGSPFKIEADSDGNDVVNSSGDPVYERDSSGAKIIAEEVQAATLLLIGYLYKDRDENPDGAFEAGYLPKPVTALLYPLRDPALA
ncbi:Phage gp6-like head-tail connector protein [Pseudomonas sp. BAY1663]|uniref:head-tail connector protein n=1 Tax=Pseudomonas sp. BAY1663 TaxID=1439940 RepID=UPI00042E047C|nr:head-tail connector protein [Pseudomonas sp. BAY1663]EXF45265.1 Phage gp6-like head-tail connector protein [Pseudomonas sp. BAY1663]